MEERQAVRILMIHGRSQGGQDPVRLEQTWIDTLRRGYARAGLPWPTRVTFGFPYYGDALDRSVGASRSMAAGVPADPAYDAFLRAALEEIRLGAGISDAEIESRIAPGTSQRHGLQNWWWVRAIARAIDGRLTPMAEFTIEAFLRDVYLYLHEPRTAAVVDDLVDAVVDADREAPTLVIGHSLGSVVAYRLLQRRRDLRLAGFVTVGSPLGLRAVAGKLGVPENRAGDDGWFNAYDRRDIVALNPLDDAHFPVDPDIVNHGDVDNPTANRHGIVGYLDDPQVAARVAAALARMHAPPV